MKTFAHFIPKTFTFNKFSNNFEKVKERYILKE